VSVKVAAAGGQVQWMTDVLALLTGPETEAWDVVVVVRYPSFSNRSRGGYIMRINLKALLSKSFEIYAHNKIVPKMSKRQLADQYSTFNYSQLSGENQI